VGIIIHHCQRNFGLQWVTVCNYFGIGPDHLLFDLKAEERREQDCYWINKYGVLAPFRFCKRDGHNALIKHAALAGEQPHTALASREDIQGSISVKISDLIEGAGLKRAVAISKTDSYTTSARNCCDLFKSRWHFRPSPGGWRPAHPKPAIEVSTDPGHENSSYGGYPAAGLNSVGERVRTVSGVHRSLPGQRTKLSSVSNLDPPISLPAHFRGGLFTYELGAISFFADRLRDARDEPLPGITEQERNGKGSGGAVITDGNIEEL
jgi:hypothetical protein